MECALKLARYHTGRRHVISFHGAFHGRTMGALSLTQSRSYHKKRRWGRSLRMSPPFPTLTATAVPSTSPIRAARSPVWMRSTNLFVRGVPARRKWPPSSWSRSRAREGYVPAPPEFLKRLREVTKRNGILLVFDEVQSGMGRTGKFFASEHSGVVADIYCIAKGVASGMPLGVTDHGGGNHELASRDHMATPPAEIPSLW